MTKKNFIIIFFALFSINSVAQSYTISGYISDNETGEILIGATIYDKENKIGTSTNEYGFYSITLNTVPVTLIYSFIGYQNEIKQIENANNKTLNIAINPDALQLNEIVVTANQNNPLRINEFNIIALNPKVINELPILFGETDIIKGIQLQTGVSTLGEGSSAIHVQGGNADQNLIIIDEAPIYNSSHLFGLVSVFNPDAVKNVELHKGSIPAEFGGRVSSVIDCQMKDGNKNKHQFSGGIGTLTAHAAIEGPIAKEKASYLIATRRSIRDLFQNPSRNVSYVPQFFDINAKLNWNINQKNRLFFSLYTGKDIIATNNDFTNYWGNTTLTFRWNTTLTPKLFSNISVIYSNYQNNWEYTSKNKNFNWLTGIEDIQTKIDYNWFISSKSKIKFGINSIYHKFTPGENNFPEQSLFRINALESSAYILNDINISNWIGINYGFRFSLFQNIGKGNWYQYENQIATGINENKTGFYHTNYNFEPRITVNLKPNENQSVKLSYSKTSQYYQVLQNSVFSYTSLQTWLPANPNIKPLKANIFVLGYFLKINNKLMFSTDAYYKIINNVIDYIDHAELINNPYIETQIKTGISENYGISFEIKRETSKLTTKASYTYSKSMYKIEGINGNEAYPALQNIPHDIRLTVIYKPIKRIAISAFWTYHSGYAATLPTGYAIADPFEAPTNIPVYTARNAGKLPDYHRLDISAILHPKTNSRRLKNTWSIGVYNVYNRLNPIGINLSESSISSQKVYLYTFFRMVPYISYNFKF